MNERDYHSSSLLLAYASLFDDKIICFLLMLDLNVDFSVLISIHMFRSGRG